MDMGIPRPALQVRPRCWVSRVPKQADPRCQSRPLRSHLGESPMGDSQLSIKCMCRRQIVSKLAFRARNYETDAITKEEAGDRALAEWCK